MSDFFKFQVSGSKGEKYTTSFRRKDNGILCVCNCQAAQNGMACKHRIRILRGLTEGIISDNHADATLVASWLPGSKLEQILLNLESLEIEAERITIEIKKAKKNLAVEFVSALR